MAQLQKAPWAGWETIRLIGRGSYGTVYEIQRKLVDEDTEAAALKVITIPQNPGDIEELHNEGYDDESITATYNTYLKGIVSEYSIMRKMEGSSNVVNCKDIHYVQHEDGFGWDIYIRMELLTPLMRALPMDVPEATVVDIGRDICSALVLCKKHEIVHRDIKPQNIFKSANGDYKLGDFGIAKTMENTMRGTQIGTFSYMAPEIYNNQPYGSTADIYSLGLVLYWLLNARRMPFLPLPPEMPAVGQDVEARLRRLSGEKLPPPAYGSEALKRIVLKACAFDPSERYATALEMLKDLNRLERREADADTTPASAERPEASTDEKTMKIPVEAGVYHEAIIPQPPVEACPEEENTALLPTEMPASVEPVVAQVADYDATAVLVEPVVAAKQEVPVETKTDVAEKHIRPAAAAKKETIDEKGKHNRQWYEFRYEEQRRQETKGKAVKAALLALAGVVIVTVLLVFFSCDAAKGANTAAKGCDHKWETVDCQQGSTCRSCGERHYGILHHVWYLNGQTEKIKCINCSKVEDKSVLHSELRYAGNVSDSVGWYLTTDGMLTLYGTGEASDPQKAYNWHTYRNDVTFVVVEEGVTAIGDFAFSNMTMISKVSLPKTLEKIGSCAFIRCTGLEMVYIPENVQELGEDAFFGCSSIATVTVENRNCKMPEKKGALGDETKVTVVGYAGSTAQDYAQKYGYPFKVLP